MRFLSENETALLIGDMSKIKLPDDVELYLSFGILQIFQRVSNSAHTNIERDWLYIPLEILDTLKQNFNNVPQNSHDCLKDIEPLNCDEQFLFPIYAGQKLDIILVSKKKEIDNLDSSTIKCLIKTFDVYKEKNQIYGDSHEMFLRTVAENNDTIFGFTKSVLNLLVKVIPRSCAGYYSCEKERLHRRIIVGEINKFDMIPQILDNDVKSLWCEYIKRDILFIPANNSSKEIQFLENPPDLNFIHNGLQSDCSENFMSVLIPGNSDLSSIHFLKTISKMIGNLSEIQFLKSVSVLEYYKKYTMSDDKNLNTFVLFEKLFILLNKQIRTTRLLCINGNNSSEIGFTNDGVYVANDKRKISLSPHFIKKLQQENQPVWQNSDDAEFYHDLPISFQANVQSELFYKLILPNGKECVIAVGTPKDISVLQLFSKFIEDAVEAFVKCNANYLMQSTSNETKYKEKIINSRLYLTGKLCSGYFNQIFSKLTVLLGKTEYLKNVLIREKNDEEFAELSKYFVAIEENADLAGGYVSELRSLIPTETRYYDRLMKTAEIMKKIPNYLSGYLHQTYVNKNISLRLDNVTQMKTGFLISGAEIDDAIIPIIISIIDDAKKDGAITIVAKRELEAEFIQISFIKSLIENDDITNLILKPFIEFGIHADDTGMFTFGNLIVSNFETENEMVSVRIRLKQEFNVLKTSYVGQKGVFERV